jgi:hypothetical protein
MLVANDDASGMDHAIEAKCRAGIANIKGYLICNYNDDNKEFSSQPCDVCGSHLAGSRHHLAILSA